MIKSNTAIVCLSPNSGGMEIDSIKLAIKLSTKVNIVLIAKKDGFIANEFSNYKKDENVLLETIKFYKSISFNIMYRTREIIKKYNIKNVIFFGASELKSLYFAFLGFKINLLVRHGTTKSRPKKDFFHRLIYSRVNYHISLCKHLQRNVEYIIPFGENTKSILIYPSMVLYNISKIKNKKLSLIHVGRITDGKGQVDAIEACKVLYDNNIDFTFYIVGGYEPKYKNKFLNFYEKLPYKDKIELVGFTKDVKNYLAKSDIFLFPSHGEGFGNSFIEGLSNNLVSIAYSNTSFIEFRELGFYFKLVQDKNIESLKVALLDTVNNFEENKKRSNNNDTLVKKFFSQDNEIDQYIKFLQ